MPPVVDVGAAVIGVLEIIGVFPNVQIDERSEVLGQRGILVGGIDDVQIAACIGDQPRPA